MRASPDASSVGPALAARRRQLHLSRAELAARCDISVDDLRRIERGQFAPSPAQAFQLAFELHIDVEPFCRWTLEQLFIMHPEYLAEHVARSWQ